MYEMCKVGKYRREAHAAHPGNGSSGLFLTGGATTDTRFRERSRREIAAAGAKKHREVAHR